MKVAVGEGLSTACGVNRQHIMIFLGLQDAYGQKKRRGPYRLSGLFYAAQEAEVAPSVYGSKLELGWPDSSLTRG